jgi:hypothetical protein
VNHQIFERRMRSRDTPGSTPLRVSNYLQFRFLPCEETHIVYTTGSIAAVLTPGPHVASVHMSNGGSWLVSEGDVKTGLWSAKEQARVNSTPLLFTIVVLSSYLASLFKGQRKSKPAGIARRCCSRCGLE